MPTPPIAPTVPGQDASEAQIDDYERLVDEHAEQLKVFEAETAAWTARMDNFDELAATLAADSKAASQKYNRALLGAAYDDIMAMSADWAPDLWDEFLNDLNTHFGRGANPPPDGTCRTCGQVTDEEAAGKAPSSST